MSDAETIVICTYLEPDQVERVRKFWSGEVLYAPDLLPVPRYSADHGGTPRELTGEQSREWRELLGRAQIAFDFDWQQPDRLPERAPRMRWVQATSAGIGGFLQHTGLDRTDWTFTTAAGVHAAPLAEFAVLGALFHIKDVSGLLDRQRRHDWQRYTATSLRGRRVTVVGLGEIGRRTATVFAGLGARVVGVARPGGSRPDLAGVRVTDTDQLDDVLPDSDVVVLTVPLTSATRHLLDRRRIALLPVGAVIVNIARGAVLDQDALVDALREDRLGGVTLDVTDPEPLPADSPLWELPGVLVSPHSASTVAEENTALTDLFLDNLDRWRTGQPLRNVYRRDVGY